MHAPFSKKQTANKPTTTSIPNQASVQFKDQRPVLEQQQRVQQMANTHSEKAHEPIQRKANSVNQPNQSNQLNRTGLPDQLKSGIENLSGYAMDDVKVHYNSSQPAQLQAHAFAQGNQIHLGPGQEKHLPHEAWHVVQQKQGRVQPTTQLKGKVNINDDEGLEREADVMGAKAMSTQLKHTGEGISSPLGNTVQAVTQLMTIPTLYGAFKMLDFKAITASNPKEKVGDKDREEGVNALIEFHPGPKVNSEKIGMTQAIRSEHHGEVKHEGPVKGERTSEAGYQIDQFDESRSPIYQISEDGEEKGKNQLGKRVEGEAVVPSVLHDRPMSTYYKDREAKVEFETTALSLEGSQAGMYYGSISWGYSVVGDKPVKTIGPDLESLGTPSAKFMGAAHAWNQHGTAKGTWQTNKAAQLHKGDEELTPSVELPNGTIVTGHGDYTINGEHYLRVTGSFGWVSKTEFDGLILASDVEDVKDGAKTEDLPVKFNALMEVEEPIQLFKENHMETKSHELDKGEKIRIDYAKSSFVFDIFFVQSQTTPKRGYCYLNEGDLSEV